MTSDEAVASLALFETVAAAMRELRDAVSASPRQVGSKAFNDYERNEQREAAMRATIRAALSEGRSNIAVVCGAWHAPALDLLRAPTAKADAARLKGLNKGKVVATWVPWTHQRLSAATGYGAGVRSPGWYHHVFQNSGAGPELLVGRWMVQVSRVLREEGLDSSPASTIEAVRLANTLATIRNRPVAGLAEIDDAILSVLAQGTSTVFNLVRTRLSVGDQLGSVPDETPMVPLARDLATQQKKLRLKVAALEETIDLDLRKPNDLAKSHLLHRLALLGVSWGVPAVQTARTTGSFHELWTLAWQPELAVALVEAITFGTTVEAAASAFVLERATTADLAELTKITTEILQADLQDAVPGVLSALNQRVAMVTDVGLLMDAVGPLARVARYGDVRRTDGEAVGQVVDGLLVRICAGLAGACASLDNDAATVFRERLDHVHAAVGLLDDPENRGRWNVTLLRIAEQDSVHGLLAGRMVRILTDAAILEQDSTSGLLSQALSRGADPERSAHWIEGFLSGSALLLLHDKPLLTLIDQWIASVDGAVFDDLIPLLRRTFSAVSSMERRMIGNAVVGGVTSTKQRPPVLVDDDRGSLVIESFLGLIGVAQ